MEVDKVTVAAAGSRIPPPVRGEDVVVGSWSRCRSSPAYGLRSFNAIGAECVALRQRAGMCLAGRACCGGCPRPYRTGRQVDYGRRRSESAGLTLRCVDGAEPMHVGTRVHVFVAHLCFASC